MKFLRIIANIDPSSGGPCQGIRNSIPEMEKLGVQTEVVSLDDPAASYLGKDAFTVHALGPGKGPWCYSSRLVPWLVENLGRFDIVIVHGLWLYPTYGAHRAMKLFKKKNTRFPRLFIMPHGMLDPYFQKAPERRLKALRNSIYWRLIEEKVVKEADGLLFTCEAELQLAREPFSPYHPRRELNVGYGISSPPFFTPEMRLAFLRKCPQLGDNPYLLFLSRIHEKKGVDLLIRVYKTLLEESGKKNSSLPKLVIAGPGLQTAFGQKIQRMVSQSLLLRPFVFFPGMLDGDAKWGAFHGCEAFVLPSHQENFGIAVVEALACGRPVLISGQVNIWQEIEAEGGGLVAPDSLEGTRQMLQTWKGKSAEEKGLIAKGALNSFEKKFSIGPAAKQLLEMVMH